MFIKEADVAFRFEYNDNESRKTGDVYFYKATTTGEENSYKQDGITGSWFREKLPGSDIEIVRVEVPSEIQSEHRAYFFTEVENQNLKLIRMGFISKAETKKSHSVLYNEFAKDAIINSEVASD